MDLAREPGADLAETVGVSGKGRQAPFDVTDGRLHGRLRGHGFGQE